MHETENCLHLRIIVCFILSLFLSFSVSVYFFRFFLWFLLSRFPYLSLPLLSFLFISFFPLFLFIRSLSLIYILICTSTGNMISLTYHIGYNARAAETDVSRLSYLRHPNVRSLQHQPRQQGPRTIAGLHTL